MPEKLNLRYIVTSNIDIQAEVANQKELNLINNISSDIEINADVSMINTLFRNLISNAIKFTPRGGDIEIGTEDNKTKNRDSNNDFITIFVKDTGIGIEDSLQKRLFKIDEKVSRPGTEDEPSTGLGLLLCKEFVEKHNGKIWVESEEDKGATFYFSLPK
jgi:signal transduction histidine kinase